MKSLKMLLLFFSVLMQMANSQEDWPCSHEIFCKPDDGILHQIQMKEIFPVNIIEKREALKEINLGFQNLCRHATQVFKGGSDF